MVDGSPVLSRRALLRAATVTPLASALAGGLAGGLAGCRPGTGDAPAGAANEITYLTGFGLFGREGYVHVADRLGFFAEQRLTVRIEPGAGGEANTQALLAGRAHFTAVDATGEFIRHGTGANTDTVIVSAVQQLTTVALLSYKLTHPEQLAGAVVGAAPGTITENLFPVYAELAGLDPAEVRFEPVEPAQLPAALATGRVDAIGLFLMGRPAVAAAAGREVHTLPYSEYLPDLFGTVHITTRALAEAEPALVARFNTAILRGLEYAIDHPDEAGEILAEAVPETDPQVAAAELALMAPYVRPTRAGEVIGAMDEARVVRSLALLQSVGEIPAHSDLTAAPERVVMFDLLPQAGERR